MRFLFSAVTASLAMLPCSANAGTFCEDLKAVLADADNSFVKLRGDFDFGKDAYVGTLSLGGFGVCQTEEGQGVATYECTKAKLPDEGAAGMELASAVAQTEACLGQSIRRSVVGGTASSLNFKYQPTADDIRIRWQRIVPRRSPPFYIVKISVVAVDLRR